MGELLKWANENNRSEFDFMRGDEDYKYRFGGVDRFVMRAEVTVPTERPEKMIPLFLYDTYTRSVREFQPLHPGEVGLYTCGPTVYDYAHIGN